MKKRLTALLLALTMPLSGISAFAKEQPQTAEDFMEENRYIPIQNEVPFTEAVQEEPPLSEAEPIEHTETIQNPPDWLLEEFENEESGLLIEEIDGVVPKDEVAPHSSEDTEIAKWKKLFSDGLGDSFTSRLKKNQSHVRVAEKTNHLVIEETDLALPGKNGLDVVIKRRYDNQDPNKLYNFFRSSNSNYTLLLRVYTFTDSEQRSVHIAFPSHDDFYRHMANGLTISSYPPEHTSGSGSDQIYYYNYDEILAKKTDSAVDSICLTPDLSADSFLMKIKSDVLYLLDIRPKFSSGNLLGYNWQLLFPQGVMYAYEKETSSTNKQKSHYATYSAYFRDLDGNIFSFNGRDTFREIYQHTKGDNSTNEYTSNYTSQNNG